MKSNFVFLSIFFIFAMSVPAHGQATSGQIITTIAGGGIDGGDGIPATSCQLMHPIDIAVDGVGNMYISDRDHNLIRKVTTNGIITTIAGTGSQGNTGDNGPATAAEIDEPYGVAVDGGGNVYFAGGNGTANRVRKVNTSGIITTIAGTGVAGFSGDNGPATLAQLSAPTCVVVDPVGNVYITDIGNNRVRKVGTTGIITTIAGTGSITDGGDGGPATAAGVYDPYGIAIDGTGNIYVAEDHGHRIRKVNTSGIITTIAGTGMPGFSGDNGPATVAQLYRSVGVGVDASGNVYIADSHNNRIRKVNSAGIIMTIVGNDTAGYNGDGIAPDSAQLSTPSAIAFDKHSNLYISDFGNDRIRYIGNTVSVSMVNSTQSEFSVYPNPSSGVFFINISSPENKVVPIIITDEFGRRIKEATLTTNVPFAIKVDVPSGIYFISASTGTSTITQKIILLR